MDSAEVTVLVWQSTCCSHIGHIPFAHAQSRKTLKSEMYTAADLKLEVVLQICGIWNSCLFFNWMLLWTSPVAIELVGVSSSSVPEEWSVESDTLNEHGGTSIISAPCCLCCAAQNSERKWVRLHFILLLLCSQSQFLDHSNSWLAKILITDKSFEVYLCFKLKNFKRLEKEHNYLCVVTRKLSSFSSGLFKCFGLWIYI